VNTEATSTNAEMEEPLSSLAEIEGRYVARVLAHTGGNKQAAARILRIDRKTLDRMIKRHNIETTKVRRFPSRAA
jgi:two-component system, NtrC family, response regulator AtoC